MNGSEHNDLVRQVREAIRELADVGYIYETSATLALLAIDIGLRNAADPPETFSRDGV